MLVPDRSLGKQSLPRLHSTIMKRAGRRHQVRGRAVVGVIADTHGLLRPEAVAALKGVDMIVHAGDIGSAAILAELGAIAPVVAVRGNNDRDVWAASIPEIATAEIAGSRLYVIHDLKTLAGDPAGLGVDVIISGHSHQPSVRQQPGYLLLNPGSAGPRRFSLPIAVARLHLGPAGPRAEIVELPISTAPSQRRPAARRAGLDGGRVRGAVSRP